MMIKLRRLNNSEFALNCEAIECIEETPDTIITLSNGHKIVVLESVDQVIEKIINYKRKIHSFHPENESML
ncbi:flagellar protein FlbD [Anaerovirgula multivorans]|uniref:Flagellar protein FlbD n=1 Tax=Anaerovirgula multivorans TaxID=312168 RepID=A0A239A2R0_9FIRM|nr:flagellar FlbD family protein [Anaerovirgula multivorans]SNR89712.1 flagellar protein FlbD [Anaerovirgula multivorans]